MTTAFSAFKAYSYGDWRYSKGEILMVYIGVMIMTITMTMIMMVMMIGSIDDANDEILMLM